MNSNQIQINQESDLDQILQSKENVFVLLYATWCPFCIRFLPIFKRCSEGKVPNFLVQDDQEIIADKYSVEVIPTVLLFKNGAVVKRLNGRLGVGLSEKQLSEFITSCSL